MDKKYRVFILVCLLVITGCGKSTSNKIAEFGIVNGVITDGRSGPVCTGVTVTAYVEDQIKATTVTNSEGFYSLTLSVGMKVDIVASKSGYASSRFQSIQPSNNQTISANMIVKKIFNNDWAIIPPCIKVTGVKYNQTISGNVKILVDVSGGQDPSNGRV